jgi:hypothetical protein
LIGRPPDLSVAFEERRVLVRLGYRKPVREIEPGIRALVGEEMDRARQLVRPAVVASVLDAEELPGHPVFRDAAKAALCIGTIGPELEREASRMMAAGDLLRGFVLDWLGSEAVAGVSRRADAWLVREGLAPVARQEVRPRLQRMGSLRAAVRLRVRPCGDDRGRPLRGVHDDAPQVLLVPGQLL